MIYKEKAGGRGEHSYWHTGGSTRTRRSADRIDRERLLASEEFAGRFLGECVHVRVSASVFHAVVTLHQAGGMRRWG
jgi:hypothetical protein